MTHAPPYDFTGKILPQRCSRFLSVRRRFFRHEEPATTTTTTGCCYRQVVKRAERSVLLVRTSAIAPPPLPPSPPHHHHHHRYSALCANARAHSTGRWGRQHEIEVEEENVNITPSREGGGPMGCGVSVAADNDSATAKHTKPNKIKTQSTSWKVRPPPPAPPPSIHAHTYFTTSVYVQLLAVCNSASSVTSLSRLMNSDQNHNNGPTTAVVVRVVPLCCTCEACMLHLLTYIAVDNHSAGKTARKVQPGPRLD